MNNNDIEQKLKVSGYKLTLQRLLIIDILKSNQKQLTPAEIYEQAKFNNSKIGLVTVYRTLEIMAKTGIVCRINNIGGQTGYLLRRPKGHHHHILCQKCGMAAAFIYCNLSEIEDKVAGQTGFIVKGHSLEFNGLCPACC